MHQQFSVKPTVVVTIGLEKNPETTKSKTKTRPRPKTVETETKPRPSKNGLKDYNTTAK